jgi:hypothetical protein
MKSFLNLHEALLAGSFLESIRESGPLPSGARKNRMLTGNDWTMTDEECSHLCSMADELFESAPLGTLSLYVARF